MAIAPVQRASNTSGAANVATLAIGAGQSWATPTSGNLIVVTANSDATVTITGSWTAGPSVVDNNAAYLWYRVSDGTESTITLTPGASDRIVATAAEYSGAAAVPFDVSNSSTIAGTAGTTTTSTSVTTAASGDLVIAVAGLHAWPGNAAPTTPSWTNSFVNQISVNTAEPTSGVACATFYAELVAGAPGAYATSVSWTNNAADRQQLMIAFKASAVSSPALPVLPRGFPSVLFRGRQVAMWAPLVSSATVVNTATLSATVGFTGSDNVAVSHGMSATLSFAGSLPRRLARALSAALSFVGALTGSTSMIREEQDAASNTGAVSFTLGARSTAGDTVLLIAVNDFYALANLLTPTGTAVTSWSMRHSLDGGTNDTHVKVWEGVVTTPGGTVVTNWGTAAPDEERYAAMFVFPHASFDGAASTDADTTSTSHVAPSVTPVSGNADDMLVTVWGTDSTGTVNYTAIPGSMTGYTERDVGTFMTCKAASEQLAAGTATGTRTATSDTLRNWFGVSVLMKRTGGGTLTATTLSATLGFTGSIVRQVAHGLAATLSFTGASSRAVASQRSATVSFTGASRRATTTGLTGARLAFTGTQSRLTNAVKAATLGFTGARSVAVAKSQAAALTFTGAVTRRLARTLAAALSLTGSLTLRTARALAASLSFTGSVGSAAVHHFTQALSATLAFTGVSVRSTAKTVTATLSLTGSQARAMAVVRAATLAFVGTLPRRTASGQSATVGFTGARTARTTRTLTAAALSFSGSVSTAAVHFFTKTLPATLGFTGAQTRAVAKALVAALAFAGSQSRQSRPTLAAGSTFTGSQTRRTASTQPAVLAFTGATTRRTAHVLSATLAFTGSLATAAVHLFTKVLSATVGFTGSLRGIAGKVLSATLGFTGSLPRRAFPVLGAALGFAPAQTRRTASHQPAALGFTGATLRRVTKGAFAATVGFAGSLTTRLMHLFAQAFTAALGFVASVSTFRPPSWKATMFDSGSTVAGERESSSAAGSFDAGASAAGEREPGPGTVGGTDQGGTSISGTG